MRFLDTVMGIPMSIDIRDICDVANHAAAASAAFSVLHDADCRFSTYLETSELSLINAGMLTLAAASEEFAAVRELAERFSAVSGGAFTLRTATGELDLNGIVKGWAAQAAADRMRELGIRNFCLNAGGDVVVAGEPQPGCPWRVGVRSVESPDRMLAVFGLRDMAIATSATYERGEHIIDGRTGQVPHTFASVSVIADELTTADVLATTVFAMGEDGPQWAAERYGCSVLAVTLGGELAEAGDVRRWLTREMLGRCSPPQGGQAQ